MNHKELQLLRAAKAELIKGIKVFDKLSDDYAILYAKQTGGRIHLTDYNLLFALRKIEKLEEGDLKSTRKNAKIGQANEA